MVPNDDDAWRAVERRDRSQDGRFVYAVATTGVYCRPSCPSRRPLRGNVRFFALSREAETRGYRPCRRCRPQEPGPDAVVQRIEAARRFLEAHSGERVTLPRLARQVGVSAFHLQRTFKALVGLSPKDYQAALRVGRLKTQLRKGSDVTAALYGAGYGSASRLYERAGERMGMTPGAYKRGGAGIRIAYATTRSKLGRLLVGATPRGVCAVLFADTDAALESALRREYPQAEIERGGQALEAWIAAVRDHANGAAADAHVPLDVQGTAFQWQVWRALQRIPPGSTRSYAQIAAALGKPRAVRAVARACAANHVALLVPCHRVVRSDGSAGGYRWGASRKQRLLDQEREAAPDRA